MGPIGMKIKDQIVDESSESDEEDRKVGLAHLTGRNRHDIVVRSEDKSSSVQNFFKSSKKNPTMFPYFEDKIKFDEYGEIIRPEDYVIAESEDQEMADYSDKPKKETNEEMEVYHYIFLLLFRFFYIFLCLLGITRMPYQMYYYHYDISRQR